MDKKTMFDRLVENALDFLEKAIDELNEHPKYSVIHFHASLELFIKARLMEEHWTLVIAKGKEPDWDKFVAGDFKSVSLDEAASRLDKVVRSGLSKRALEEFQGVAKDRNKMIHFFHKAHSPDADSKQKQEIIKKQLTAWYFLHTLLREQWKNTFAPWSDRISDIDKSLRKFHEFLKIIFDNLKDEIKNQKRVGILIRKCPSCGFKAKKHSKDKDTVYKSECMVCNLKNSCLQIECEDCDSHVFFEDEGFSVCKSCKKKYEPDDLVKVLIDAGAAYTATKDGDDSYDEGNCDYCDGYHTVARTENNEYICTSCFEVFEFLERCGWCNDPNTGDMEASSWAGCNFCSGKDLDRD